MRRFPEPADDARDLVARARSFERQGAPQEACVAYDMALALIEGAPAGAFHADVLRHKGTLLRELGETAQADALYRRSLDVSRYIHYTPGVARAQTCLAAVHQRRGQLAVARELYSDASASAVAAGEHRLAAMIAQHLAVLATVLGHTDDTGTRYRSTLRAFREARDEEALVWVLANFGMRHTDLGSYDEAEAAFERALAFAHRRGDIYLEGLLELGRTEMFIVCDRLTDAEATSKRALAIAIQRRDQIRHAKALQLRAAIAERRGVLDEAAESLDVACTLATAVEDAQLQATVLRDLGAVWHRRGDCERARELWRRARDHFLRMGAAPDVEDIDQRLALLPPRRPTP